MSNQDNQPDEEAPSSLRQLAEERLQHIDPDVLIQDADPRKLVHELQVHQIELQLQNEALLEAQAELERALTYASSLFDFAPIPYLIINAAGRIVEANHASAKLFDEYRSALCGKALLSFVSQEDLATLAALQQQAMVNSSSVSGEIMLDIGGHQEWVKLNLLIEPTNNTSLIAFEIITERKQAEAELRAAKRAAELASASKTQFLAHMSHEIRTPLNAVMGFTQLLEHEPLSDDQHSMVHSIQAASNTLLGIINDILDFSKIEAGKLTVEQRPFNLNKLLNHVEGLISGPTDEKGLSLQIDGRRAIQGLLIGDALRIEQVLLNLIGNAIKFTERGGVTIRVKPVGMMGNQVRLRFEIQDTGIGLAPDSIALLFKPFTQADSGITRRLGGTGLGLCICKRLVELMGGNIGVASTPNVGSTFWFELPFGHVSDEGPASQPEKLRPIGPRLQGLRILVADDVKLNLLVAESALKREGAVVTPTTNGQEVLDCLRANPTGFDLVLIDIQMPVMDGLTATRAIRDELKLEKLPVIALTAGVLAEERQSAIDAGINDFLPKPMDLDLMAEMIQRYGSSPSTDH